MMRILDNHIGYAVLLRVALVFGVLLGLFAFVSLIGELEHLGDGGYTFARVLRYVLLSVPGFIYELFPLAILLGAILALAGLAADSELVVMRAGGVSLLRIGGAMLRVGLPLIVAVMVIGEYLAPLTQNLAEQGRARALHRDISRSGGSGVWLRDGAHFVNIGEVLPDASLRDLRVYTVGDDGALQSVVYAARAVYDGDGWRLPEAGEVRLDGARAPARGAEDAGDAVGGGRWRPGITPELLAVFQVKPSELSAWRLLGYIGHLRDNGQRTAAYELALWHKLLLPLVSVVMVLLAIPAVFVHLRSATMERSVATGILTGLAFYILHRGSNYLVLLYDVPPLVGALAPPLVFLGVALVLVRRVG